MTTAIHVTDLARQAGVTSETVRYYTRLGLLRPRRQKENRYRLYDHGDVARLRFIRQTKSLGFTIAEVRQILNASERLESSCPLARGIINRRIRENRWQLREMMKLQRRMEAATRQWRDQPDTMPGGHSICHLIEQVPVTADDRTRLE